MLLYYVTLTVFYGYFWKLNNQNLDQYSAENTEKKKGFHLRRNPPKWISRCTIMAHIKRFFLPFGGKKVISEYQMYKHYYFNYLNSLSVADVIVCIPRLLPLCFHSDPLMMSSWIRVSLCVFLHVWCKWWEMEAEIKGRGENRPAFVATIEPLFGERRQEKGRRETGDQIMLYEFCWYSLNFHPVVPLIWLSLSSVFFFFSLLISSPRFKTLYLSSFFHLKKLNKKKKMTKKLM